MQPPGPVEVGLSPVGDQPHIAVRDHGKGVCPEELPHLFGRFHPAADNRRKVAGTGIGLYLVKRLTER